MKCDTCKNKTGYTLGPDECGAGNYFEYCTKDHWNGGGPRDEEEYKQQMKEPDPWLNCKDYLKQIPHNKAMNLTSLDNE